MPLFLAVPVLVIPFIFMVKYRDAIVRAIRKIRLPNLVLALLTSVVLMIPEEHVNCGAYGCAPVFFPPTIPILVILELIFFFILYVFRVKSLLWRTIDLSIMGFLFEFIFGSASKALQALLGSNFLIFLFILIWTAFSYAFVYFLPLALLQKPAAQNQGSMPSEKPAAATG
ncbi:MAG TPA: hypothetical protein VMT99_01315 [Candidatus Paceibacterota bacterium]|nr:hypothetical protein [Candidatus Paceibacterota bacterium]